MKIKTNFHYLKLLVLVTAMGLLGGCAPEVGSEKWCEQLKEKPKTNWLITPNTACSSYTQFTD